MQFRDLFDLVESIANDKKSKIFVDMHRLKHLGRIIKAQRAPQWPAVLPSSPAARRRDLPPRPLADQLVQCYLRSSEGLFRVLHVPLFLHQALCWEAEPDFKAHLTIQTLQNSVLLLLAREAVGLGSEMTWTAVGSLLRCAVYMGLHRDPLLLHKRATHLAAEMRRRLWNTILELAVKTGLTAGGPVMLSLADFEHEASGEL